jgi:hypothetical protein
MIQPKSRGVLDRPVKPDDDGSVVNEALTNPNPYGSAARR